jgi:hypothetical protein
MEASGQLHAPAALPPAKEPRYRPDRRLGEPQNQSGWGGEEKCSHPLPGLEPSIIQPLAQRYTTELSELQCSTRRRFVTTEPRETHVYFRPNTY